jgi:folate receptor
VNTSETLHNVDTNWYGFNYNHCGKMSEKCRIRFLQELCMYECDPYLEKWIVAVNFSLLF